MPKKYLLTAADLCEYGLAVTGNLGIGVPETLEFVDKFLAEHEYHERTCHMVDNGVELCCSECDCRHDYDDEPQFCMGCGAKAVG